MDIDLETLTPKERGIYIAGIRAANRIMHDFWLKEQEKFSRDCNSLFSVKSDYLPKEQKGDKKCK